jgi:hypothetical protein
MLHTSNIEKGTGNYLACNFLIGLINTKDSREVPSTLHKKQSAQLCEWREQWELSRNKNTIWKKWKHEQKGNISCQRISRANLAPLSLSLCLLLPLCFLILVHHPPIWQHFKIVCSIRKNVEIFPVARKWENLNGRNFLSFPTSEPLTVYKQ